MLGSRSDWNSGSCSVETAFFFVSGINSTRSARRAGAKTCFFFQPQELRFSLPENALRIHSTLKLVFFPFKNHLRERPDPNTSRQLYIFQEKSNWEEKKKKNRNDKSLKRYNKEEAVEAALAQSKWLQDW
jgi:hypothetical protein